MAAVFAAVVVAWLNVAAPNRGLGAQQTLTLTTDQDAYLVGVVTVTAPMCS